MFYTIKTGKDKGKILNLDENDFNYEDGLVTDENGKKYRIDNVRPLTQEEIEKCCKVEEIQI